jgi:hypothetical protein
MPIEAVKTEVKTPAAGGEDGLPPPVPGTGQASALMSDEELVAGIEAELAGEEATPAPPKPGEPPPAPKPGEKPPEKKDGEIEVKLDAAASKSIEATNRYRAQAERALQQQAEALTKRETELAPRIAQAEAYEKAKAQRDPEAIAEALGFGRDEYETLAQTFYRLSKSASPTDRAAAAQLLKQRQSSGELERLQKTVEDLTKSIQQRDVQAQQQAFVAQYTTQLTGAVVATEHTLVANALKNAPREATRELQQLAARMEHAARGATPEPAEVVKEYEQVLRRQAQALGFDPAQVGKQNGTTTTPTPETSGQKKTTAGLTQDLGPQTRSRTAPKSRDEAFEETERELEEQARKSRRT